MTRNSNYSSAISHYLELPADCQAIDPETSGRKSKEQNSLRGKKSHRAGGGKI